MKSIKTISMTFLTTMGLMGGAGADPFAVLTKDFSDYPEDLQELINIYMKSKTACSEDADINIIRSALVQDFAEHSQLNKELHTWILPEDIEVEAKVEVCSIKAHTNFWVRDRGYYLTIEATGPVAAKP